MTPDLPQTIVILTPVFAFWVSMSGPLRWFTSTQIKPMTWYDRMVCEIPWDGASDAR